jgi:enterochelin esterase-like enzyme
MHRPVLIALFLAQLASARCWTKDGTANWVTDKLGAVAVFNDATGEKIGDLTSGKLNLELENFQDLAWSIRNAEGKTLETGTTRIEHYPTHPGSLPKDVPKGKVTQHTWNDSKIYPGTHREYLVYVPAQYDASKPAALLVFQDGLRHADPEGQIRATTVLDNLIAKGDIPVTIGVFINPGRRPNQGPREKPSHRSVEYDSLGDTYARFLLEEILPEVGRSYKISDDPNMRSIAGGSSAGICSWTVCWERPDSFRKALIWVGTFVDIRGGNAYPSLVRKTEKKPIRAYLLDGENDLDNKYGNWPLANRQMAAALKFKGYDYHFEYGKGFHGSKAAAAIFPDMLRWTWRDWKTNSTSK